MLSFLQSPEQDVTKKRSLGRNRKGNAARGRPGLSPGVKGLEQPSRGAAGLVSARLEERAPETVKPNQTSPERELLLLKSDAPSGTKHTVCRGRPPCAPRGRATAPTAPGLGGAAATPQRQSRGACPAASRPAAPVLHLQAPGVQDREEQAAREHLIHG